MFIKWLPSFYIFIVLAFCPLDAKPPPLTPRDARIKIEEILKVHVSHQYFTSEIAHRALLNYIDALDPGKTYFLEGDIAYWLNPSQQLLSKIVEDYKKEDFSTFVDIHTVMLQAIERRSLLETELDHQPLLKDATTALVKDMTWSKTGEELLHKLLIIKSLQIQTAEKIDEKTKDQFFQRLSKRRLNRETELQGGSKTERMQLILSYVLKSVSSGLDSQTIYFTPSEANQFMIQVQQRLFGIGAQLRDDLDGLSVVHIIEGSPAAAMDKLKIGDKIIAVNNDPVVGLDIVEAVEMIRGPQGSIVDLTILRDNRTEPLIIELVRGEIVFKEFRLDTTFEAFGDGIIATLHLFSFYQDNNSSSAEDLASAIAQLKKEHHIKGIILDLRNNAGGLLPQAVAVTGLFISKGVVVSIKDNSGQIQHLRNVEDHKIWDGPLVVLTARTSASAAEIVAQTLQDYGRALVIGDPETFGKGTFQTFTLESSHFNKINPKGEYKVTRGRYYTVSGKSPQLVGVKSDIVVPGIFSGMEIGEKYSKFPIENEQIASHFIDDLEDISILHRNYFDKFYKNQLQAVETTYESYLEILKHNSEERISKNKNYQRLLNEISKKEDFADPTDFFSQSDLQLVETVNILKDFLYLKEQAA